MAAILLAPFSIVVLAVLLSQKLSYTPNIATEINGYGLNSVLASTEPLPTGLEAFYSYDRFTKKSSKSTNSRVFKILLLSLLLLGGDIQLNPGPNWKFPCGSCNKPVKKNQKGSNVITVIYGITQNAAPLEMTRITCLLIHLVLG